MAETVTEASISERVFRVGNRPLMIIALGLAIVSIVPLSSLHELITTGTIDFHVVTDTRHKIPHWLLYGTAWPMLLGVIWFTIPLLRYFRQREMFTLGQRGIIISGVTLAPEEVLGFRYSLLRGYVLRSTRGEFPVHPYIVRGGPEALSEALPHLPPLKKGELPDWVLD